jgi:hypothetical protein
VLYSLDANYWKYVGGLMKKIRESLLNSWSKPLEDIVLKSLNSTYYVL